MIKTYGFFGLFGLVLMASSSVVAVSTVAAAEVQPIKYKSINQVHSLQIVHSKSLIQDLM
jgi:hypothetical protein